MPKQDKEEFAKDFNQKYADTFLIARIGKGDDELVYVAGAHGPDDIYSKDFEIEIHREDGTHSMVPFVDFSAIEGIPKPQYFNLDKTAYFVFRKPERQWKRGLCVSTTAITEGNRLKEADHLFSDMLLVGLAPVTGTKFRRWTSDGAKLHMSMEIARKLLIFPPIFPTYIDCCRVVRDLEKDIQAFHPHYAVSVDWRSPNLALLHDRIPIAEIDSENSYLVTVKIPLFLQEIRDLFRKLRIDVTIQQKVL